MNFLLKFCCIFTLLSIVNCENDTNYLLFTQRWTPGACKEWLDMNSTNSCYDVPKRWTIHGLWPQWNQFCNDVPLDLSQLGSLIKLLSIYWPTTRNLTNNVYNDSVTFWRHEWDKHGTCAMSLQPFDTDLKYFLRNIELSVEYNIYEALKENSIIPSDNHGYKFEDIRKALIGSFGKNPDIICTADNLINEVRLCFNLKSQLIDCTILESNCKPDQDIMYR